MEKEKISGANFYAICPKCGKPIPFQGIDIQYYQPIGAELAKTDGSEVEVIDTGKIIACPFCEEVSKAKDCKLIVNDY